MEFLDSVVPKLMGVINEEIKILGVDEEKNEYIFGIEKSILYEKLCVLEENKELLKNGVWVEFVVLLSIELYSKINEDCIIEILD